MLSQRHKNFSQEIAKTKSIASLMQSNEPAEKASRKIELQLCAFLSEHHLPISLCEPLLDLLKARFPDETSLKKVKLGKQRASNIIRQVFGKCFLSEVCEVLRERMFSVIIDETTDRSTCKQMSVIVQLFREEKPQSLFLDLIEVTDSSAKGLFAVLKKML